MRGLFVCLLFASLGLGWQPASSPSHLSLSPALASQLLTLTAGLHREIHLCLTGWREGDTAYATGFRMPVHALSSARSSTASVCGSEALARFHNHPRYEIELTRVGPKLHVFPMLCTFGKLDVQTTRRFPVPFVVVGSGEELCWWSFGQVLAVDQGEQLPSVRGQAIRTR